ncbi:MAG TPA: RepB family plasmid replication initiator protein [Campylobacterales bacterium]|nr:RepB family plasmid replication initiator protein [Campylobacterales bacterium]
MDGDLTKRNHTRQSHIIVNSRYALTRAEIDIVLTLLTSITKEDEDFKDYKFSIGELESKTGRKWNSKQLKNTVKSLMSKPLELPTEDEDDWEIVNWFSYFKYSSKGMITCRFDKRLKPYLIEIIGTRILADFRHLLPMKSSYSKRIYLLLKQYNKIGSRTFEVEKLQNILKVPNSHKLYSNFKIKVLKRAEVDINKFTDLEVTLSERKRARKVVEITYTIRKNTTDLKTFIQVIRELYVNKPLFNTKDNRLIMCNKNGLLYYDDEKPNIDKKESQKLWEYLHENRKNLYVFKASLADAKKQFYLSNIKYFKSYLKEEFAHKKIIELKKIGTEERLSISIFPNGRLYDMSGDNLDENSIEKIWKIIYVSAKKGELKILNKE